MMHVQSMELRTQRMSLGVQLRLMMTGFILETRVIGETVAKIVVLNGASMDYSRSHHRIKKLVVRNATLIPDLS